MSEISAGELGGPRRCRSEDLEPSLEVPFSVRYEPVDISLFVLCEHHADRRHEVRCDVPALQDDLHQNAPRSPVAVLVRVDRFELCVCECRLGERRQRLGIAESAEVVEEGVHLLGWRRYEVRAARVVVVAADPVLLGSYLAGDLGPFRSRHEEAVNLDNLRRVDLLLLGCVLDRGLHCVDVGEDLERGHRCFLSRVVANLGSREDARVDLYPFDL